MGIRIRHGGSLHFRISRGAARSRIWSASPSGFTKQQPLCPHLAAETIQEVLTIKEIIPLSRRHIRFLLILGCSAGAYYTRAPFGIGNSCSGSQNEKRLLIARRWAQISGAEPIADASKGAPVHS